MKRAAHRIILALALLAMLPFAAAAQEIAPAPYGSSPPPAYTEQQLDQLTAPIALYPDQLVGQILMAATYPLEIVEAYRWQQQNAHLSGDQLQAALDQQPWDPSVKSLIPFPQVLSMMNNNLQWTEQLGDAFLGNQPAVMDSVQRLRAQAQSAGNLQSSQQQTVTGVPGAIEIVPANPQVVYVPVYNPQVVYGPWLWPGYPPYYFPPPPRYTYTYVGPIAFFTTGIILADWFWGWNHWDWHEHHIDIDEHRWVDLNRGRPPHFSDDVWEHNPNHRHGVPYNNPAIRSRFQPAAGEARRNFRGYAPRNEDHGGAEQPHVQMPSHENWRQQGDQPMSLHRNFGARSQMPQPQPQIHEDRSRQIQPQPQIREGHPPETQPQAHTEHRLQAMPQMRAQPAPQLQRSAPVFESFSRGPDVRAQSARGAYSRSTRPAVTPQMARPAAPSIRPVPPGGAPHGNVDGSNHGGGGNRGGGDNRGGRNDRNDRNDHNH